MKMLLFITIGILGLTAAIILILYTIQYLIMMIIAKNFLMAILFGFLFFIEMFFLNYIVNENHGE